MKEKTVFSIVEQYNVPHIPYTKVNETPTGAPVLPEKLKLQAVRAELAEIIRRRNEGR